MPTMSDEYQIEIPPSFQALYIDARKRLTVPMTELRDRYELCEDLANHLTEHCRNVHADIGDIQIEVLQRCHQGLSGPDAVVSGPEAVWVVTRLAELLYWPMDWQEPTPAEADEDDDTP
jgi:hypothetical protein